MTVKGNGAGGPNQEYALGLAIALDGATGIAALAGDTDGTDGGGGNPDDPAGAIVLADTLAAARAADLNPANFLENNDSTGFFSRVGGCELRTDADERQRFPRHPGRSLTVRRTSTIHGIGARPLRRAATMLALPAALAFAATGRADLCNSTASSSSIGYQDPQGWTTEGWWNIASQTCETLLKGAVPSRFIYVHAVDYDRGGEWIGTNFMCTQDKSFAIRVSRTARSGATSAPGFFEVDTGEAKEWTIRLTDPDEGPAEGALTR